MTGQLPVKSGFAARGRTRRREKRGNNDEGRGGGNRYKMVRRFRKKTVLGKGSDQQIGKQERLVRASKGRELYQVP